MPNIKPASADQREEYRATLEPQQVLLFNDLVEMVEHKERDLRWHHRFGTYVQALLKSGPGSSHGTSGITRLASALGPSDSVLRKACQFTKLYPDMASVMLLTEIGTDWTHLTCAFRIKPEPKRHELLQEAVRKKWSPGEFATELQKRFPSPRRGHGGRERKDIRVVDAAGSLAELLSRSRDWMKLYDDAFKIVEDAEWQKLMKSRKQAEWTQGIVIDLKKLLAEMTPALKDTTDRIGRFCKQITKK